MMKAIHRQLLSVLVSELWFELVFPPIVKTPNSEIPGALKNGASDVWQPTNHVNAFELSHMTHAAAWLFVNNESRTDRT